MKNLNDNKSLKCSKIEMFQNYDATQNILHVANTNPSLLRSSVEVVEVELIIF